MKREIYHNRRLIESYWPADTTWPLHDWTLGQALREAAAEVPDRIALVEGIADTQKKRQQLCFQSLSLGNVLPFGRQL